MHIQDDFCGTAAWVLGVFRHSARLGAPLGSERGSLLNLHVGLLGEDGVLATKMVLLFALAASSRVWLGRKVFTLDLLSAFLFWGEDTRL